MKAILNHQSYSTKGRDMLVIDGELSEFAGTPKQVEAQKLTCYTSDAKPIKITRILRWFGASASLRLYKDKCKFWIISNFLDKDEIGRKIPYVFFCETADKPFHVRKLFEDYCIIAKMKPTDKDCAAIEKALKFEKNKKRNIIIAILIALILLIIILNRN